MEALQLTTLFLIINSVRSSCPTGWTSFSDSCYLFHTDDRYTWDDAEHFCWRHHSHLVFIETAAENNFLVNKLKHMIDLSINDNSDTAVWTGGTDEVIEHTWMWYGVDKEITGYQNWHPGEPDSGDGDHSEDCMCMVGRKHFEWNDYSCREHMYFVCEKASNVTGSTIIG